MHDDLERVRATMLGDWEAFGAIVRKYANVLHAVTLILCGIIILRKTLHRKLF